MDVQARVDESVRLQAGAGSVLDSGTALRVLVADDQAPIRLLCRVTLEYEGLIVLEARDGIDAIGLAAMIRKLLGRIDQGGSEEVRAAALNRVRALASGRPNPGDRPAARASEWVER